MLADVMRSANLIRSSTAAVLPRSKFTTTPTARAVNNFNDPDAAKPTLEIDSTAKSERLGRPGSPHLLIYQPQLTWYMSGLHRFTGAAIGTLVYGGAIAYALVPFNSAEVISYVHSFPVAALIAAKVIIATPTVYHCLNGLRHLTWDTTRFLSLKGVYNTGYTVLAGSTLLTLYLAMQ
ncbi:hypothetical protein BC832DRAFT_589619 [Gaertneriomyces semiglobifer]|nr:hypothetical protein BC832DRAFT_589619 [Gaertneriomyces semiglobifer]